MHKFKDTAGREWTVEINVSAVKRVRKLLDVDLLKVLDKEPDGGTLLGRLGSDLALLVDVLFVLVKPDADERNVTDDDFGRAFSGDVIMDARTAFLGALTDFFPDPRARTLLAEVLRKGDRVKDLVMAGAVETLGTIDADAAANALIKTMRAGVESRANGSKSSSGSGPESSDSIPAPSVSAS